MRQSAQSSIVVGVRLRTKRSRMTRRSERSSILKTRLSISDEPNGPRHKRIVFQRVSKYVWVFGNMPRPIQSAFVVALSFHCPRDHQRAEAVSHPPMIAARQITERGTRRQWGLAVGPRLRGQVFAFAAIASNDRVRRQRVNLTLK